MANHQVVLKNLSAAPVTVNSQTVAAGATSTLTISDTTADLYAFLEAGLVAGSATTPGKVNCPLCGEVSTLTYADEPSYLPPQP
jgi:hypothetical protein